MRPANEKRRYIVTSSLIGWTYACRISVIRPNQHEQVISMSDTDMYYSW